MAWACWDGHKSCMDSSLHVGSEACGSRRERERDSGWKAWWCLGVDRVVTNSVVEVFVGPRPWVRQPA